MPRTPGATQCTPTERRIAAVLSELGYSWRKIALLMGRSDKTVAAAADANVEDCGLTDRQSEALRELIGLHDWLSMGRDQGYLDALAAWLGEKRDPQ